MLDLASPVQYVKGIGPQRAVALAKLGLGTAEDLLFHLPMRYEDRRSFTRIADLRAGMKTAVAGTIVVAGLRRARRMTLYEVRLEDASGRLKALWFNQRYLATKLKAGQQVVLSGKPRFNYGRPELLSPDPTNIVDVVSTLERWIYGLQDVDVAGGGTTEGVSYGYQAYIHAPSGIAAYAGDAHLVEDDRDGNGPFKRTPLGSIWVFGGGYNGAAPGEADQTPGVDFIYVTGQVTVWRDPDVQTPPERQTFNRSQNQWMGLAERTYVVGFDCHVAAAGFESGAGVSV